MIAHDPLPRPGRSALPNMAGNARQTGIFRHRITPAYGLFLWRLFIASVYRVCLASIRTVAPELPSMRERRSS